MRQIRPVREMTPEERDAAKDKAIEAANAFAGAWRDETPGVDLTELYLAFVIALARVQTNIADPDQT